VGTRSRSAWWLGGLRTTPLGRRIAEGHFAAVDAGGGAPEARNGRAVFCTSRVPDTATVTHALNYYSHGARAHGAEGATLARAGGGRPGRGEARALGGGWRREEGRAGPPDAPAHTAQALTESVWRVPDPRRTSQTRPETRESSLETAR